MMGGQKVSVCTEEYNEYNIIVRSLGDFINSKDTSIKLIPFRDLILSIFNKYPDRLRDLSIRNFDIFQGMVNRDLDGKMEIYITPSDEPQFMDLCISINQSRLTDKEINDILNFKTLLKLGEL
ncbi:hypothetical protein Bp8pS_117 [Bacillus phage vB_BpuM-BpSp]|nr:hypothetical protein Bp8pS_117 [Bacillus phage vB_BpuM-BpSp]